MVGMFSLLLAAQIWLGGDVFLGRGEGAPLRPLAALSGVGIVNLEGPVGLPAVFPRLTHAPAALGQLRAAGIRVAGIANNHSANTNEPDGATTARALREAGVLAAGLSAGAAMLELDGMRVAVTAHDLSRGVPARLAKDLREARARADLLVATFHVAGPSLYLP